MSKAKDNYYELNGYLDRYMGGLVNYVSNYVTELENKAKMFDEMVKCIATAVDLLGDCNAYYEIGEDILDRAKKIQEAGE